MANANKELIIEKILDAPRNLVFEVFTKPDHIKHWWGPNGFTNTVFKMDVRAGGEWEFMMHGPDGTDYKNKNIFREIIIPEKIVFDHVSTPVHTTTITFTSLGNKTHLRWHMLFESAEQLQQVIKTFKADEGLKQNIERLSDYLILQENAKH